RRIAGAGIDLARFIFAREQLHLGPFVVDVGLLGAVENFLHKLRRNEIDTFAIAKDDVARHHGRAADADGHVDAGEHDIADGSGMHTADINRHVERINALEIAYGAIDHKAGLGRGVDGRCEIVAYHRAVLNFSEKIDHQDVAGPESVDDALVGVAAEPFGVRFRFADFANIGAVRHELRGHSAAHEFSFR